MMKLGVMLAAAGAAGMLVAAGAVHEAPSRGAKTTTLIDLANPSPEVDALVRSTIDTSAYSLQRLTAPAAPGDAFSTTVSLDGQTVTLNLESKSNRAPGFRVWVHNEHDEVVQVDAPASAIYRGTVEGFEGSVVSASLIDGRLNAYILLDGGVEASPWMITPLSETAIRDDSSVHVVHRASDGVHRGWVCGAEHDHDHDHNAPAAALREDCILEAQIAYDADFQFYQLNGESLANTIADVELIHDNMNIVYERDINLTFVISDIIVRTSAATNPYTSNNAGTLLDQFRAHWNANFGSIERDIAHLMTGRSIDGSTIGIAWVGAVCSSFGYGLSQSRFSINLNFRTALTAHEVGHNFSMGHCSSTGCHIMCASLNGCSGVGNPPIFGATSISTISSYAQGRPCIDEVCTSCPGDLDGNGVVDGTDLGILLLAWGNEPTGADADLDDNGVVNGTDLGILLLAWGPCP